MTRYSGLKIATVVILVTFVVISPEARADEMRSGWYVSGNVGATFPSSADFRITSAGAVVREGNTSFDSGFSINGVLGYGWGNLRVEGEVSWRQFDVDSLRYDTYIGSMGPISQEALGTVNRELQHNIDVSLLGLMANAWYDFDTGTNWIPSIGVGLGAVQIDLDAKRVMVAGDTISDRDKDWVFAYQVGASMGYSLSDSMVIQLGYRYLHMGTSRHEDWTRDTVTLKYHLEDAHNAEVGIRYRF